MLFLNSSKILLCDCIWFLCFPRQTGYSSLVFVITVYLPLEFDGEPKAQLRFNSLAVTVLSLAYNVKTEEKGP